MDWYKGRIEKKIGRSIYKAIIELDFSKTNGVLSSEPLFDVEVYRAMEIYKRLSIMDRDEKDVTPLLAAVLIGSVALCRCFIEAGLVADFDKKRVKGISYLSLALENQQYDVAKLLIEFGANVNDFDERGRHVMSYAIEEDTPVAFIEDLLSAGCPEDGDMYKTSDNRPLTKAIVKGNIPVVKCLLKRSVDVNYITTDNITPLNLAVQKGYSDITEMLVQMGSSVNCQNVGTPDPLFYAVQHRDTGCLNVLIKAGAKVNNKIGPVSYETPNYVVYEEVHTTALHVAVSYLNYEGAKVLLENGARVNATSEEKNFTPLHELAQIDENMFDPGRVREVKKKYCLTICKLLLQHGACYNYLGRCEDTPMMVSRELFFDDDPCHPFHSSLHSKVFEKLLKSVSRLFKMIRQGNKRIIKILKKKRGSKDLLIYINCINNKGNTMMAEALECKFPDIAEEIMALRLQLS